MYIDEHNLFYTMVFLGTVYNTRVDNGHSTYTLQYMIISQFKQFGNEVKFYIAYFAKLMME